jgi:hypothetical protein
VAFADAPVQNGLYPWLQDPMPHRSTLKRPPAKALVRFHVGQVGDDTVRTYLENGFSLAICCKDCPRLIEWTPHEMEARFGGKLQLRIADIASRLTCAGEEGCGSHDIAVFPHLYDGVWRWSEPKA